MSAKNVLGGELELCCTFPVTGFFRDGFCNTGPQDHGAHVVCIKATEAFLTFSKEKGNDLTTPFPVFKFPGLTPGDKWCLCATRWQEAYEAGAAPSVILASTHEKALEHIELDDLMKHAIDLV